MKIHLIAIGGAAMHNIALDLQLSHQVTGSDDEIYNPSKERLAKAGLLPKKMGWFPERITEDIDIVILGMHAKKDNPELLKAQDLNLKIYSYPEFVYHHSKDKKRVVIAGSHGKTTTTSMIMHVLKNENMDFDYLVGANIQGFERMVQLSDAPMIILEGDEYLSSPIDRRPKMLHYQPELAVITGIAWDHINVFPTEANYNEQFSLFIESIKEGGSLYYFEKDAVLGKIVSSVNSNRISVTGYNEFPNDKGVVNLNGQQLKMGFFGGHNFQNMQAAILILEQLGISQAKSILSLQDFSGAQRRLQLLYKEGTTTAYLDFAHAPSKVKATTKAMKSQFPERKIVALLELHTFSSLNSQFIPQYKNALAEADMAIVYYDSHTLEMKGMPSLPRDFVADSFNHPNLKVVQSGQELKKTLHQIIISETAILVMSSGNLGGLDITKELKEMNS